MKAKPLFVCLLVAGTALAQRHKPIVDPETKEGYVIQLIQQERSAAQKTKLLNDFVVEFPKSASLSWAYDQLLPVYVEAKDFDKVVAVGTQMVEVDPNDLDAAHTLLMAAEEIKNPDLLERFSVLSWKMASRLAEVPDFKHKDFARQLAAYSEFSLASLSDQTADAQKKQDYLKELESLNPKSAWLRATRTDFASLAAQGASPDKLAAVAEKSIGTDPDNEDMLITAADAHMRHGDGYDKVIQYSSRVVEILRTKQQPPDVSAADWQQKKDRYLAAAYYMIGVVSSIQGRYIQADTNLRAALPSMRGAGGQVLGAILYHLGYANYQLAEQGQRGRVFDAIKFNEQCATVPSTYREQAQKNIDSIKTEYNLK